MTEWDEIAAANEEGRRNVDNPGLLPDEEGYRPQREIDALRLEVDELKGERLRLIEGNEKNIAALRITQDEMDEAADALEMFAGIDEGENTDTERLHDLALRLRKGDSDAVPVWLREMLGPKTDEERRQRRLDLIAEVIKLREERANLTETVQVLTDAGVQHIRATEGIRQAVGSLIDLVDELCMGLAAGQTPDREWAEVVSLTLSNHRRTLGFNETF